MSKRKRDRGRRNGKTPGTVSKDSIREHARAMAAKATSHGTRLDPDALAVNIWKSVRHCLLCQPAKRPSYVMGVWVPGPNADPVVNTGLQPDQARFHYYGLCAGCYRAGGSADRAEAVIADRMLAEANARAALDAAEVTYTTEALPDGSRMLALSTDKQEKGR